MLWHSFKTNIFYEVKVIFIFAICYILCRIFNITCPIYKITGILCPTCKMGRALLFLLKGNVGKYIEYNVMALPIAIVFLCELFSIRFGKYVVVVHIFSVIILIINVIYYLVRINVVV